MPFSQLGLLPGTRLQVSALGSDHRKHQFAASYIGYQPGQALLISPQGRATGIGLRPGLRLVVSVALPTTLATFATTVESITRVPFPHIYLRLPGEVRQRQLRAVPRVQVTLPLVIRNAEQPERSWRGEVLDLSLNGLKFGCHEECGRIGETLQLTATLRAGGVARDCALNARIRSRPVADTLSSDFPQVYGVEFVELGDDDRVYLHGLVMEQLHAGCVVLF